MPLTLAEAYLTEYEGDPKRYRAHLTEGLRLGQSFFNALSDRDKVRIVGTMHDPFHSDLGSKVEEAIEFLLY